MTRFASAALMPLADAVPRLIAGVAPVAERALPSHAALGFAAAHDVIAERGWPERPTALRDGWAVQADAVTGASAYAPIPSLAPPVWVEAGEILPEGADTVLPPEALEGRAIVADAPVGDGVRRWGEDLAAGTRLLAAGTRIAPCHLLTLGAAGDGSVAVRIPRLALIAAATPLADALSALIAREGVELGERIDAPRTCDGIAGAIRSARADAVLVLGGTGPGRTDRAVAALALAGEVLAHGIALRPGETAAFGRAGGRPVLLLPGRPEAALAVFLALGRPLLAALSGVRMPEPEAGTLLRKVAATIGVSDVVFVRRRADGRSIVPRSVPRFAVESDASTPCLEPLGGADLALSHLAEADGAILVPPEREGFPEGTSVGILPL
ncbi:molybdopterin-binding protein [Methylobacterium sp. J-090]|uniref:molybdopterin-binding protein n=1 Tax=Methylobacterium sp. J-090 TaxID=2836666 RepID=UPI001FB95D84|nr:molybdopterin-binding protein [Methylobacterium sp. J-090]MCJ2080931.1 molybdopterin-binding protein [Methylobacterium sp. J-090]